MAQRWEWAGNEDLPLTNLSQVLCSPGRAGSAEPLSGLLMLSQLLQEQSQDPALEVHPESSQDGGRHQNPLPTSEPAPKLSAETSMPICVPTAGTGTNRTGAVLLRKTEPGTFFPKFLLIWTPRKWGRACEVLLWSLGIPQLLPGIEEWGDQVCSVRGPCTEISCAGMLG